MIVRWNDTDIAEPGDLTRAVADTEIGSEATVELIRDGERQTITTTVGRRPAGIER